MRSILDPDNLAQLLAALDARFVVLFSSGAIRVLGGDLSDTPAVCAILPTQPDGVLRIVYDPNKTNALAHTRAMLAEWWESYAEPEVFPDGTVEFLRPPCPRAGDGIVELQAI